jgi:hypothetical protein
MNTKYNFLFIFAASKHTQCGQKPRNIHTAAACAKTSENYRKRFRIGSNRVGGGNKPGVRSIEELDSV